MVKSLQTRFDTGLDWISNCQEDGYLRCQCPRCEKLDKYRFAEWHQATSGRWRETLSGFVYWFNTHARWASTFASWSLSLLPKKSGAPASSGDSPGEVAVLT